MQAKSCSEVVPDSGPEAHKPLRPEFAATGGPTWSRGLFFPRNRLAAVSDKGNARGQAKGAARWTREGSGQGLRAEGLPFASFLPGPEQLQPLNRLNNFAPLEGASASKTCCIPLISVLNKFVRARGAADNGATPRGATPALDRVWLVTRGAGLGTVLDRGGRARPGTAKSPIFF